MPGTYGYTGQRADSATGLDYYQARYYDPVAGQFTSADSVQDGLNRYAYVGGNPETATDPSGHRNDCGDSCDNPGSGTGTGTPTQPTTGSGGSGSGGQVTTLSYTCDDACQQANAISALTTYYEHERLINQTLADVMAWIADAGNVFLEVVAYVLFHIPLDVMGVIADVANLLADAGQVVLDIVQLVGRASERLLYEVRTVVSVLHGLAFALNIAAGGWAFLNVLDGIVDFAKDGWKAVLKEVWKDALQVFLRSGSTGMHYALMSDEQIDIQEAALPHMGLQGLKDLCKADGVTC